MKIFFVFACLFQSSQVFAQEAIRTFIDNARVVNIMVSEIDRNMPNRGEVSRRQVQRGLAALESKEVKQAARLLESAVRSAANVIGDKGSTALAKSQAVNTLANKAPLLDQYRTARGKLWTNLNLHLKGSMTPEQRGRFDKISHKQPRLSLRATRLMQIARDASRAVQTKVAGKFVVDPDKLRTEMKRLISLEIRNLQRMNRRNWKGVANPGMRVEQVFGTGR